MAQNKYRVRSPNMNKMLACTFILFLGFTSHLRAGTHAHPVQTPAGERAAPFLGCIWFMLQY